MARGGAPGRAVRAGLIGGVAVVFLAAVGMLEKFDSRNLVGDIITLAGVMMSLPPFLAAWVVVRPRVAGGGVRSVSRQVGAGLGALTGAAAGLVVVAGLVLVQILGVDAVRSVFIAVSPALIDILTFGLPLGAAAAVWLAGGAVVGALGATLRLTSPPYRRSILAALIVTLLAALLQRVIPTALFELGLDTTWLYSRAHGGLTLIGAVVVFAVSLAAAWWWVRRGDDVRRRIGEVSRGGRSRARGVLFLAVVGVLILMPLVLGSVLTEILGTVAIFALMGLGLNIVVGYAGLLDLGYVAFFAVGAYAMALFTGAHLVTSLGETADPAFVLHLSFYQALPLVIGITALIGALIGAPVLRLRGDYLAIVTLGFGEIARVLITSDWLKEYLGGAQGLRDITDASLFGVSFREVQPFYYLALAIVLIAVYVSWRLSRSRVGRAWTAMREDEQVAEAMGVSTIKFKLLAFAIGAAIGSLSGALFAVKIGSLSPISFGVLVSITALAIVILGGLGSIPGVLVGALVLIGLPALLTEFEEYRLLLYGAVLMGIMILRPAGLIPNVRRSRELQEEERSQDEWLKETGAVDVTNVGIAVGSTVEEEPVTALLEVAGVRKRFGGLNALDDLHLHVEPGEIVSVIGPNGAGKSTFFNVVTGLYPPDEGDIRFQDQSIVGLRPNQITRLGISRTFQSVHLFPNMTILENAMVGQHCRTKAGVFGAILQFPSTRREERDIEAKAREALSFFGSRLAGYREEQLAVSLSYANRRRLEMARAMATEPVLLLLDEPTAGMNPRETQELTHLIGRMRDQRGHTIVVIEHDMRVVKGVSDRVIALDYGRKIAEGTYEQVAHDDHVVEAYLGRKAVEGA